LSGSATGGMRRRGRRGHLTGHRIDYIPKSGVSPPIAVGHGADFLTGLGVLADHLRLNRRSQERRALGACHHRCLLR
jgi:hypothetical protein